MLVSFGLCNMGRGRTYKTQPSSAQWGLQDRDLPESAVLPQALSRGSQGWEVRAGCARSIAVSEDITMLEDTAVHEAIVEEVGRKGKVTASVWTAELGPSQLMNEPIKCNYLDIKKHPIAWLSFFPPFK